MTGCTSRSGGSMPALATIFLLAVSLIVGACAGVTTPTDSGALPTSTAAGQGASPTAGQPSATATQEAASATPGPASPTAPASATSASSPSAATGVLASLIPNEIGGMTIEKESYSGREYIDVVSGGDTETIQTLEDQYANLGGTIEDVSMALGTGFADDNHVRVEVLRVAGADAADVVERTVQNVIENLPIFNSGMSGTSEPATVGGKQVALVTVLLGSSVYEQQYLYGYGDTVFTVTGGSDEVIAEALSLLP